MTSVTIITIVVIALLTVTIGSLAWLSYSSCIREYEAEVNQGQHDDAICEKYHSAKKRKRIVRSACSYVTLGLLMSFFAIGLACRIKGDDLVINGQTALVIKSRSMSSFYDEALAEEYKAYNYDIGLQFDVGDICFFDTVSADATLIKGEVYGYKRKNIIITHRLTAEYVGGWYEFRGDNNPVADGTLIQRDRILYHYTGRKIPGLGAFILYAQSYFGLWSLSGILAIAVGSELVFHRVSSIERDRYVKIHLWRLRG